MTPRVFIGSATESRRVAETVFQELRDEPGIRPDLWSADNFSLSQTPLDSLRSMADHSDAAVLVFSSDDTVVSRGVKQSAPRDNIIYEAGLFAGVLGSDRVYLLHDADSKPKIPSDLKGSVPVPYRNAGSNNQVPLLSAAISQIKDAVRSKGVRADRRRVPPTIYWCAPHKNPRNHEAKALLERYGITVNMPSILVPPKSSPAAIRRICSEAIRESDLVAVDIDSYGLDCAWEMGYAEALDVRVIGVSRDYAAVDEPRILNKRKYLENETHGWDDLMVTSDLEAIAAMCKGKVVHVCCPFENETPMVALRESPVSKQAKRLIFPKDELDLGDREPRDYSWRTRDAALRLLTEADIVLAVLPRYGMDTAWKLGYAAALDKETIGWLTEDTTEPVAKAQILDHWMHGWKHKGWITGLIDLAAIANGLAGCGRSSFVQ